MSDYLDDFRENLKYYRMLKGWSQSELAIQANSSNGQIGNVEAGSSKPSFDLIVKVSKALEIHPADLFLRDVSKIQDKDLYRKYQDLIQNCEYIPDNQKTIVKNVAKGLAEATPDYPNYK